ncbi:MAG: ABC transporter ATP-binding protein, partial [Planctomycetaceae bacterium]
NLDAKLRIRMRGELKRLQKDLGITAVYVTHDQEEAMTMSDRIAILRQGVLQQVSKPMDAYLNPSNQWVAGFIGSPSMNFFDCHAHLKGGQTTLVVDDLDGLPIPLARGKITQPLSEGQPLTLGVRPEHLMVAHQPGSLSFTGSIYVIEPVGEYTILEVMIGKSNYSMKTSAEVAFPMGARIQLTLDPEKTYLFDRETGLNLIRR